MDLDRKRLFAKRAYAPYRKETLYCLAIDIALSMGILFLGLFMGTVYESDWFIFFYVFVVFAYFVFGCLSRYKISLISIYENKKCQWEKKTLTVEKIKIAPWGPGHHGENIVHKFYDKKLSVNKYKLICKDEKGKKIVLRTISGAKRIGIISQRIYEGLSTECTVYYGKYTRIAMYYKSDDGWTNPLNYTL